MAMEDRGVRVLNFRGGVSGIQAGAFVPLRGLVVRVEAFLFHSLWEGFFPLIKTRKKG